MQCQILFSGINKKNINNMEVSKKFIHAVSHMAMSTYINFNIHDMQDSEHTLYTVNFHENQYQYIQERCNFRL